MAAASSGSSSSAPSVWNYEVVIVMIVLFSSVLAYALDAIEHYTRTHAMAARVADHVYEEITLLGAISLLLYAFQDAVIEAMGGTGPINAHLLHEVHMLIFYVAVIYVCAVCGLMALSHWAWTHWKALERKSSAAEARVNAEALHARLHALSWWQRPCRPLLLRAARAAEERATYHELRQLFVAANGLPLDFNFYVYLRKASEHVFVELTHVPPSVYMTILLVVEVDLVLRASLRPAYLEAELPAILLLGLAFCVCCPLALHLSLRGVLAALRRGEGGEAPYAARAPVGRSISGWEREAYAPLHDSQDERIRWVPSATRHEWSEEQGCFVLVEASASYGHASGGSGHDDHGATQIAQERLFWFGSRNATLRVIGIDLIVAVVLAAALLSDAGGVVADDGSASTSDAELSSEALHRRRLGWTVEAVQAAPYDDDDDEEEEGGAEMWLLHVATSWLPASGGDTAMFKVGLAALVMLLHALLRVLAARTEGCESRRDPAALRAAAPHIGAFGTPEMGPHLRRLPSVITNFTLAMHVGELVNTQILAAAIAHAERVRLAATPRERPPQRVKALGMAALAQIEEESGAAQAGVLWLCCAQELLTVIAANPKGWFDAWDTTGWSSLQLGGALLLLVEFLLRLAAAPCSTHAEPAPTAAARAHLRPKGPPELAECLFWLSGVAAVLMSSVAAMQLRAAATIAGASEDAAGAGSAWWELSSEQLMWVGSAAVALRLPEVVLRLLRQGGGAHH